MSIIKPINNTLKDILGRDPTIYEQIDVLILTVIKERAYQLQLAYQMSPDDTYKEEYDRAVRCVAMIHERNPDIFVFKDSDGGGDDYI